MARTTSRLLLTALGLGFLLVACVGDPAGVSEATAEFPALSAAPTAESPEAVSPPVTGREPTPGPASAT